MAVDLGSVLSAPEGIRTPNLLIRSQMLYPLSYGRVARRERASDTLACGRAGHEIGRPGTRLRGGIHQCWQGIPGR